MKKGHYGEYTGNARHSRKQEMIHDRELIYDAKTQLHQADQDYKNDSPLHYRPGDIHSGSTGAYDAENNEFSAAIAGVEGGNLAIKAFGKGASDIITAVGKNPRPDQKEKPNMDMTKEYLNKRGGIGAENKNPSLDSATYGPNGTLGGGNEAFDPNTYGNHTITPTDFENLPTLSGGSTTVEAGGGGKLSSFDNAWTNDLENIRTSGMYGGSDNAAKARYIQDVGGQGETLGKGNAREYANEVLPFGATYDSAKHQEDMMSRLFKNKRNSNIPGT